MTDATTSAPNNPSDHSVEVSHTKTSETHSEPTQPSQPPRTAELIRQVSEDSSRLVRAEIALAKLEVSEKAKQLGIGVGAFAAAAVLALFGVGALIATMILVLALILPVWAAALIVTVIILAAAGVAALLGKNKVSKGTPPIPQDTIASLKEDAAVIKESARS